MATSTWSAPGPVVPVQMLLLCCVALLCGVCCCCSALSFGMVNPVWYVVAGALVGVCVGVVGSGCVIRVL